MNRCACGCGEPLPEGRSYVRWHNRRGQPPGIRNRQAVSKYHQQSCVPSEPILRLLEARQITAAQLARETRIAYATAFQLLRRDRWRRTTAERMLRWLADLPRNPNLGEQRTAEWEYQKRERKKKAEYRQVLRQQEAQQ